MFILLLANVKIQHWNGTECNCNLLINIILLLLLYSLFITTEIILQNSSLVFIALVEEATGVEPNHSGLSITGTAGTE